MRGGGTSREHQRQRFRPFGPFGSSSRFTRPPGIVRKVLIESYTTVVPKRAAIFLSALLAATALWWIRGTVSAQTPVAPPPAMAFLITLGNKATSVEKWDGSAQTGSGTLVSSEGWHFSAGDEITALGRWKAGTRRDEVAPYADIHYTEMRPGERPAVLFHPVGVFLTVRSDASPRISIQTAQGNFQFNATEIGNEPANYLNGRVSVARVPAAEKLTTAQYEDDEPSIAALPDGAIAVAWVAYRDRADRILFRTQTRGIWSAPEEVSPKPADIFRTSLACDSSGNLWLFWSEREKDRWHIWSRVRRSGAWQTPERLTDAGSSTFHRAAAGPDGNVFVTFQSYRGAQSDIYLKAFTRGAWAPEIRLSESRANDWEPAIATAPDGSAHVAWDTYDAGNYDIHFRSWQGGKLSPLRKLTSSAKFQAHAAVAVDEQNHPWVAWNESGVNWGKDQGFLIPTPLATPLHQQRALRLAMWDGARWMEPVSGPLESFPEAMRQNSEHPQIRFSGGALTMLFRHWARRNNRTIGSPNMWENYLTRFDGSKWTAPQPLPDSAGSIEKHPALARDAHGEVWAAWMTDARPFSTMIPGNADVYCARLEKGPPQGQFASNLRPFADIPIEAIPIHVTESQDVQAMRAYSIRNAGKDYKIYRGDMHRHTDVSQDFKYDGSLLEGYRYALDAAALDYIALTDHQAGYDQEFTWWQNQKLVDLFLVPGAFAPLYAYERSVPYPNGHRNVIFAHGGVRTLPIPPEEQAGKTGAALLYEYLKQNGGISMPHSTATSQGTDWRDNDPVVEPLVEIYQGYRNSYEYEGAPRSATALNPQAQKSGWEPAGFWWNALAKGYKLGVQASSDHWSTHISYACILAESLTREGLLDAIRKRHAYGATDNLVLDFRARADGKSYIMGDAFASQTAPQFTFIAVGTGTIQQVDLIKNRKFIYTAHPGTRRATFEFTDRDFAAGESYYYARVLQQDGQIGWTSPIWVKK